MDAIGKVKAPLGQLQSIDVREYWKHEALEFTPWLAQEENLALLGQSIGIELELTAVEQAVGPFSADILCKNTLTGEWVLIENQLEKTDHSHLGQIITYAAGLQATSIIWIARQFTEEHRAALDWLNEYTPEKLRFFGVTVELWQIGDSPYAPRFHVVSKPNTWSKSVSPSKGLTSTQESRIQYWTAFGKLLETDPGLLKAPAPSNQNWVSFSIGKSGVNLNPVINPTQRWIRVEIYLGGPNAKSYFQQLLANKNVVEATTGALDWQLLPDRQDSRIALYRHNIDPMDQTSWPAQHSWLWDMTILFHKTFAPFVKQLKNIPIADVIPKAEPNIGTLSGA